MSANPHRARLFAQLNGLVFAPIAHALYARGVPAYLVRGGTSLSELQVKFGANAGYLNVALRCLASMGYLDYTVDASGEVFVRPNARSAPAFSMFAHYAPLVDFQRLAAEPAFLARPAVLETLAQLLARLDQGWIPESQTDQVAREAARRHIEGGLVGPLLAYMGLAGAFTDLKSGVNYQPLGIEPASAALIAGVFTRLGWLEPGSSSQPTEAGRFFFGKAPSYGVPVSYLPMLTHADELIFGNVDALARASIEEDEQHVDRPLNVWGSGHTHTPYFVALENAAVALFDKPIEQQPIGIADMGCGDGALLTRLYRAVVERTARGRMLGSHPLRIFGVDYNRAALEVTRAELARADVPATLVWGDVGRPDLLAESLQKDFGIELGRLLNVRTFLDHNRPWNAPAAAVEYVRENLSTGAFAHHGQRVGTIEAESSLTEHFSRWTPYVRRHGLLVAELHTIDSQLAAQHPNGTLAPAYDAMHGFSDQYIVELDVFLRAAAAAGLYPEGTIRRRFPDSDLATVSVNLLLERRQRART
jgi:hypothetical protein